MFALTEATYTTKGVIAEAECFILWRRFGVIFYTLSSENEVLVTPDSLLGLEMSGLRVAMVLKCNQWKFSFLLMEQHFFSFFWFVLSARRVLTGPLRKKGNG